MKAYLEIHILVQTVLKVDSEFCKQPIKTRSLDLYYENLHIKYYYFICQCEDYFKTASVKIHKHILFAA